MFVLFFLHLLSAASSYLFPFACKNGNVFGSCALTGRSREEERGEETRSCWSHTSTAQCRAELSAARKLQVCWHFFTTAWLGTQAFAWDKSESAVRVFLNIIPLSLSWWRPLIYSTVSTESHFLLFTCGKFTNNVLIVTLRGREFIYALLWY